MAVPPTLVMSVNVLFVVGAVSVPGLWSLVEYLSKRHWSVSLPSAPLPCDSTGAIWCE